MDTYKNFEFYILDIRIKHLPTEYFWDDIMENLKHAIINVNDLKNEVA